MTPYGRGEARENTPDGWPEAPQAGSPVGGHGAPVAGTGALDADGVATWGPTSRPCARSAPPRCDPRGDPRTPGLTID